MKRKISLPKKYILGKYAVGTECFSFVDTGRKEVLGDGIGDRKIAVRMYFPVDPENVIGKEWAAIFSDRKKEAVEKAYFLKNVLDACNQAAFYENVPVSGDGKFPLILFSMGYNSYAESNTYLLTALASFGYIIASVGHAYEAVENDYEDGTYDLFDKKINKRMYTSMAGALLSQFRLVSKKRSFEDALEKLEEFQDRYFPYMKERVDEWKMDMEKALAMVKERYADSIDLSCGVGASGHSLGGCLAYYLCRYNDVFSCGINIDGGLFGEYPEKTMEKPFCQISCKENINVETRPFLDTNADTYQIVFRNTTHIAFTDVKFYLPQPMLSGKISAEELFRNLVYCHVRFFDRYLKGMDVPFKGLRSDNVIYKKIR